MEEDDIDLDALLDAQSSGEDDADLPELDRSIDDILLDAEEEEEATTGNSAPSRVAVAPVEKDFEVLNFGSKNEESKTTPTPKVWVAISDGGGTVPFYQVTARPSPRPGAALAAATAASRQAGLNAIARPVFHKDVGSKPPDDSREALSSKEALNSKEALDSTSSSAVLESVCEEKEVTECHPLEAEEPVLLLPEDLVPSSEDGEASDETVAEAVDGVVLEQDFAAAQMLDRKDEELEDDTEGVTDEPSSTTLNESSEGSVLDETVDVRAVQVNDPECVNSHLVEAEEAEKQAANSGLHLEEGAAAQPMQLEGIQRGPPAIGLLQLDWGGPLSFALSSIGMMRDHGSPRCLAVHTKYIAMGMSKGTILLASSRYSATSTADNNEAKVMLLNNAADKSHASVSVLCFSYLGDLLLAGYTNGSVTLWDVQKAAVAKAVTGEHQNVIVHAAFVGQDGSSGRPLKAITADCKGVVMLHTFTLLPLLRRFSVTTQCLLDGQRGIVLSLAPLISEGSHQSSSGASVSGPGNDAGRRFLYDASSDEVGSLFVFVTQQIVLVFRLLPSLEICANLTRPEGVREGSIPYTSWRRISPTGSNNDKTNALETTVQAADDNQPLLAIAWGKKVLVLQLQKTELKILAEWEMDSKGAGIAWLGDEMLIVATVKSELYLFTKEGVSLERVVIQDGDGHAESLAFHTYFLETCNNPEKVYANSLGVRGAAFYLLGTSKLWRARLLPWQDRIKALQDAGDWMGAFQIAMELFDGRARGVTGLPSGLQTMQAAIMPNLLALLSSYIDEAFVYVRLALGAPETEAAREQYARVGRVAIEFCVHISRTDVLFQNVFQKFHAVGQAATFLELLEPYILKDMLCGLAPEVMQALVEHYSSKGWVQRVEQCILHMEIASLDFNQVMRLCRDHGLFSALIYLFNKGLKDFKSPVEELLIAAQDQQKENPQSFGYKLLVYLKYCFSGLAFPPGRGSLPDEQMPELKLQLLEYLLDPAGSGRDAESVFAVYPRLHYLLDLDVSATLDILRLALGTGKEAEKNLVQVTVDPLVHIVETVLCMDTESNEKTTHILRFLADYVSAGAASVPHSTLDRILHMFMETTQENMLADCEESAVAVLEAVPEEDWNPDAVIELAKKAQFWRVSALAYTRKGDYISALNSHLKDLSGPCYTFCYVISKLDEKNGLQDTEFRAAVMSHLPQLVQQDRIAAFYLIMEYYHNEVEDVLKILEPSSVALFNFLKALMEVRSFSENHGDAREESVPWNDRSKLATLLDKSQLEITDEMVEQYIELLCRYEPDGVLPFLQNFENYRLEQCLKLCQKYGVRDGAAFLLERVGDVGAALTLTLNDLSALLHELDAAVAVSYSMSSARKEVPEEQRLHSVKNAGLSLCQRNTFRLDPVEAESLWFHLLDRFIHPLHALNSSKQNMSAKPRAEGTSSRYEWKVLQVDSAVGVLRKMLSECAKDIVAGMIGHVPVQVILNKIISDHGNHELGDFKDTILEMLSAYDYELAILGTARRILEADMFHDIETLKRERSRGLSPITATCVACAHPVVEDQTASKAVQIFSCGHFVHLGCMDDIESSSNRCPVCLHQVGVSPLNNGIRLPGDTEKQSPKTLVDEQGHKLGVSRFELLKSLERGESMPVMNSELRLQLSPPVKFKHKPSKVPSIYSSNTNGSSRFLQPKLRSVLKRRS